MDGVSQLKTRVNSAVQLTGRAHVPSQGPHHLTAAAEPRLPVTGDAVRPELRPNSSTRTASRLAWCCGGNTARDHDLLKGGMC